MKKSLFLAGSSLLLAVSLINPVYAIDKTERIVDEETETIITIKENEGYTTRAYSGGNEKITPRSSKNFSTMDISSFSMKRGKYAEFYDETLERKGDGHLKVFSSVDVDYTDTSTSVDYITLKGYATGFWSGSNPYDADRITIVPSQTIGASGAATAYSYPAAVSVNSTSGELTFTWPADYRDNAYSYEYEWKKLSARIKGSGTFKSVIVNDAATFKFGSKGTAILNTLDIAIK